MNNLIEKIFKNIQANKVLEIAKKIRSELSNNPALAQLKDKKEYVTEADIQIQRYLLEYFSSSALAGKYIIKAEEKIAAEEAMQSKDKQFQLIVDPLDGTNAFCKGEETWGAMVGLCDRDGKLVYSWNMISNGETFSTSSAKLNRNISDWNSTLDSKGYLSIDVYDYDAGSIARFPETFLAKITQKISSEQIQLTSYQAAVWAGHKLYKNELNGLLWLQSDQGKGSYPDYDLSFLGALKAQGWKIALGKQNDIVKLIAVAPSESEMKILWETGVELIGKEIASSLICDRDLKITSPIGEINE